LVVTVDGPGGQEIASLQRRALASAIDGVVLVLPAALVAGGGVWLYMTYRDRRSGDEDPRFDFAERLPFRRLAEPRWRLAVWAVSAPIEVGLRNWRSPGARAMGLRRVDARTGGPVSVRSAVIRNAINTASGELSRWVRRPSMKRFAERRDALAAELKEVRRTYSDEDDRRRAMKEISERRKLRPWKTCGWGLLGLAPRYVPALWSVRNQTALDRVTGIVVVVERGE
jgi:uncharacterized RDD family membrane protein YckC